MKKQNTTRQETHCKTETESEEITIKIPKQILEFLKDHESDPKDYLEKTIIQAFRGDLQNDQIWTSEDHIKRYNLENILKLD